MRHLTLVSRRPCFAADSQTSPVESLILMLLSIFFRDWDNYSGVAQSLQKYYNKTP